MVVRKVTIKMRRPALRVRLKYSSIPLVMLIQCLVHGIVSESMDKI